MIIHSSNKIHTETLTFTKKFLFACQDAAIWNEDSSTLPADLSPSILNDNKGKLSFQDLVN